MEATPLRNPKTTVSGILGLLGSVLLSVGIMFQHEEWGQALMAVGSALSGASGVGNMFARDAKPAPLPVSRIIP